MVVFATPRVRIAEEIQYGEMYDYYTPAVTSLSTEDLTSGDVFHRALSGRLRRRDRVSLWPSLCNSIF